MRTIKYYRSILLFGILGGFLVSFSAVGSEAIAANGPAERNRSLEKSVTNRLRSQGLGQESRILILASSGRVFLLGVVPDANSRMLAGRAAQQVPGVRLVENFLITRAGDLGKSDTQLEQDIRSGLNRLGGAAVADVRPKADEGTVVLQGRVNDWRDVARAVQMAFIAGADYVVSQLSTGAATGDTGDRARSYSNVGPIDDRPSDPDDRGDPFGGRPTELPRRRTPDRGTRARSYRQDLPYYRDYPDYRFGGPDDEFGPDYGDFEDLGQVSPWDYDYDYDFGDSPALRRDRLNRSDASGLYRSPSRDVYGSGEDSRYEPQWVQSAQDRRLQQQIGSRLRDAIPTGSNLYVLVQRGQAFLFGRVRNQTQREQAVRMARNTQGIERVQDQLSLAPQGWRVRDDAQIRGTIRDELYWSPFVDAGRIEVDVDQGVATLSGVVDSFGGMVVAVGSAFQGGARTVRNQLRVVRPSASGSRNMPTDESAELQL